jgi:hypothetical protein
MNWVHIDISTHAILQAAKLFCINWLERSERSERRDQPTIFWSDFVVVLYSCTVYIVTIVVGGSVKVEP